MTRSFALLSRLLHWTMALLILAMLFIGVAMVSSLSDYHRLVAIHRPLGILLLVLVAVRLINRLLSPPPPLPADRWAQKDLGMLQGCWRLGRDTEGSIGLAGRSERCAIRAGRICFSANGGGERQATANCPATGTITCTAPITARFGNDSTLRTSQPAVRCNPSQANWTGTPNSLTCRRVSDTLAICRDGLNFEHEFRRD